MRLFSTVVGILGLVATLVPAPAIAEQSFDLRPDLTKAQFAMFTAELGSATCLPGMTT